MSETIQRELEVFDPLEEVDFDAMAEQLEYEGYVPPILTPDQAEEKEREDREFEAAGLSVAERIERTIKGMPGERALLLHVVEFCKAPQNGTAVMDEIEFFRKERRSIYDPETVCSILVDAGALRMLAEEFDDDFFPTRDVDGVECLVIDAPPEFGYVSSPEAIELLENEDAVGAFAALVAGKEAKYTSVYRRILRYCQGDGLSKKELDAIVDADPIVQSPRMWSGHFIDKLEEAGAIVFESLRWKTTQSGSAMLAEDGALDADGNDVDPEFVLAANMAREQARAAQAEQERAAGESVGSASDSGDGGQTDADAASPDSPFEDAVDIAGDSGVEADLHEGDEQIDEAVAELAGLLQARVGTYALLARMYYEEADDQLLNDIRSMNIPAYTGEDSMDAGYRDIIRFMRKPNPNMVHELRVDFCRTFIGGGNDGYSAAYPFESVYSSPRRLMMQNARDEILVLYRAAGLDKSDVWSEGEDHIVAELEFMQVLGQRACDYLMAGDLTEAAHQLEVSLSFLEDHLRAWFPMMAADMRKFAKTSFYRGLADVTIGFFDSDLEFLHDMLVPDSDVAAPREVEDEIVLDLS